MAQNIDLMGNTYNSVPAVQLPKHGGGTATFTDLTPTTATAADVASPKVFFLADGTQTTGSATARSSSDLSASGATVTAPAGIYASEATKSISSGSAKPAASISSTGATLSTGTNAIILSKSVSNVPDVTAGYIASGTSGNTSITLQASATLKAAATITPGTSNQTIASGTYLTGTQTISGDANLIASNIKKDISIFGVTGTYDAGGGGGSGLTLLATYNFGSFSGSATSATNTNKSMTVTGYNDYDVLVVDVSVNSTTNGRHTSTVSFVMVTGQSNVTTKDTYAVASNKWNSKLSSSGTATTRQSTTAYGIYAYSASVANSTMTITFYYRYNSNNTGTINGTYTARVYGLKLYDLIGG